VRGREEGNFTPPVPVEDSKNPLGRRGGDVGEVRVNSPVDLSEDDELTGAGSPDEVATVIAQRLQENYWGVAFVSALVALSVALTRFCAPRV